MGEGQVETSWNSLSKPPSHVQPDPDPDPDPGQWLYLFSEPSRKLKLDHHKGIALCRV